MSLSQVQLSDIFSSQVDKMFIVGKVFEPLSPTLVNFVDQHDDTIMYQLDFSEAKEAQKKHFVTDQILKIIHPSLDQDEQRICVTASTLVFPMSNPTKREDLGNLKVIQHLDPKEIATQKIALKVVSAMEKREVKTNWGTTSVRKIVCKDVLGNSTNVSLWSNHCNSSTIRVNAVYYFENLMAEKYPEIKPHFLGTSRRAIITEITAAAVKARFADISEMDGTVVGTILGFQDIYNYKSCPFCKCSFKGDAGDACGKCKKIVAEIKDDFRFSVVIQGDEEPVTLIGFKSALITLAPSEASKSPNELEAALNDAFTSNPRKISASFITKRAMNGEANNIIQNLSFVL